MSDTIETTADSAHATILTTTPPKRDYPAHVPAPLQPGVYFGLDELVYHNDPALGSSDMKRLAVSPCDFWYCSKFNPLWEPEEATDAQKIGSAAHVAVLEGMEAFKRRYACVFHPGNIKEGKAERFAVEQSGRTWLRQKDYQRIMLIAAIARNDPEYGKAFTGGVASEVSIFWTDVNGIRKKARIDYLKTYASVDYKTTENTFEVPFRDCCIRAFARYRYDAQWVHYHEAREHLADYVRNGLVFGTVPDTAALEHAAEAKEWATVFVFSQKSDAPLVHGMTFSPGNGMYDYAKTSIIDRANANWLEYGERFGFGEMPWLTSEPLREYTMDDMPPYFGRE